ncbi:hypothetical protein PS6_002816 [Mucor atramentarius]
MSVGTVIKREALCLRPNYHSVDVQSKAIVLLGLNSILGLSFKHPDAQTAFFHRAQWKQLRAHYPLKKYNVGDYTHISEFFSSIRDRYNKKKSFDVNWLNLYKELKRLDAKYDPNIEATHNDLNFCVHLMLQILSIIKYQPSLLEDQVDSSEWDFVVKFWGVVTERLVHATDLRLKWGDTHLTVHGIDSAGYLKVELMVLTVDMRILHDKVRQRYNAETDIGVCEAAEEDPGNAKYIGDRCKVMIESKAVIDRFVLDGCLIDSVDSLQVCGPEVHFGNTSLAESGLYVGTQFYSATIDKSLSDLSKYLDLAFHLLCFHDQCVSISNQYEEHLIKTRSKKVSTKRTINDLLQDDITMKQASIRGSWNPPRTSKSPPPPPKNLFGNDS